MGQAAGEKDDEEQETDAECGVDMLMLSMQSMAISDHGISEEHAARPQESDLVQKALTIEQVPVELILYHMKTCIKTCACLMH